MTRRRAYALPSSRLPSAVSTLVALGMLLLSAFLPGPKSTVLAQRIDPLVMIIASSAGVTDISSETLRTAFLGLPTEHRGLRLIPLNLPLKTPLRDRVDRALLGLEPSEVGSFWVDQRVRDGRNPPRTLPSVGLAVRIVAQLPGAITYVPASMVEPNVRALRIDGRTPVDRGYLLATE